MDENQKEIEVVSGDGSNLEISPVYDHLNAGKPKTNEDKPKNIVIPKVQQEKNKKLSKTSIDTIEIEDEFEDDDEDND